MLPLKKKILESLQIFNKNLFIWELKETLVSDKLIYTGKKLSVWCNSKVKILRQGN